MCTNDDDDCGGDTCTNYPLLDCSDSSSCCASSGVACCVDDDYLDNWFKSAGGTTGIVALHVTADPPTILAVGQYSGDVYDEDSWQSNYVVSLTQQCADSQTWHKNDDPAKDCQWVADYPQRCTVKDLLSNVRTSRD